MKKIRMFIGMISLMVSMTACGNNAGNEESGFPADTIEAVSMIESAVVLDSGEPLGDLPETEQELQTEAEQEETEMMLNIQVGEHLLTATLARNSSVDALVEMLSEGEVTINMNDYANMEKVGALPKSLPRNDEQIRTGAGDLILYQGNSFVIYYDTNSWNLTRLGKVNDVTQQELKDILGEGSVTVVLSLPAEK